MAWIYDVDAVGPSIPPDFYPPPGYSLTSGYTYPGYKDLQDGDEMTWIILEFSSPFRVTQYQIKDWVERAIPNFQSEGEELVAFTLSEKQEFQVDIPDQICFFGNCFTPPGAGTNIVTVWHYRLYLLSRLLYTPLPATVSGEARPLGLAAAIGICLIIIVAAAALVGVWSVVSGRATFQDLRGLVKDVLTAPGENFKPLVSGLTWAGLGLGVTLIGMSILIPIMSYNVGVTVPVGQARVKAGAQATGAAPTPAPAPPPRRR